MDTVNEVVNQLFDVQEMSVRQPLYSGGFTMSWSVAFVGKAPAVAEALEKYSETLTGVSREEYDAAKPHLIALVQQNHSKSYTPTIQIEASGHGEKNVATGEMTASYVQVSIKPATVTAV